MINCDENLYLLIYWPVQHYFPKDLSTSSARILIKIPYNSPPSCRKMWAPIHMRKIFVGGIDYTTTDESLKEHFSAWGEVVDAVVMKDPATNR